jgi:hypothetical protein
MKDKPSGETVMGVRQRPGKNNSGLKTANLNNDSMVFNSQYMERQFSNGENGGCLDWKNQAGSQRQVFNKTMMFGFSSPSPIGFLPKGPHGNSGARNQFLG